VDSAVRNAAPFAPRKLGRRHRHAADRRLYLIA
jgi:hypothetical protein